MKKTYLIFLLVFTCSFGFSQNSITIYLKDNTTIKGSGVLDRKFVKIKTSKQAKAQKIKHEEIEKVNFEIIPDPQIQDPQCGASDKTVQLYADSIAWAKASAPTNCNNRIVIQARSSRYFLFIVFSTTVHQTKNRNQQTH